MCSPVTFRKALHAITYETVRNMFEKLRGVRGHMMSDATPSERKNEYVDFCASLFDTEDRFRVVCLGSKQVQGPLDTETYERHIITVGDTWGARFSFPGSSMIPGEIYIGTKECTEFLLVRSCSDMGSGAHGAFKSLFGEEGHIPCTAVNLSMFIFSIIYKRLSKLR